MVSIAWHEVPVIDESQIVAARLGLPFRSELAGNLDEKYPHYHQSSYSCVDKGTPRDAHVKLTSGEWMSFEL